MYRRKNECSFHFYRKSSEEIFPCVNPWNQNMADFENRIRTFDGKWPRKMRVTPLKFAESGLFYLGCHDRVKCFYCNGGLQNFETNDDPWFEHAKWYPDCEYVLKTKGMEYVSSVAGMFPNIKRPFDVFRSPSSPNNPVSSPSSMTTHPRCRVVGDIKNVRHTNLPPPANNINLSQAMQTEVVKEAQNFGFDPEIVAAVVRSKFRLEKRYFESVAEVVDEIQLYEALHKGEGHKSNNMNENQVSSTTVGSAAHPVSPCGHFQKKVKMLGPASVADSMSPDRASTFAGQASKLAQPKLRSLLQEIEDIKQENMCKICLDRNSDSVLIGCRHVCVCAVCASAIRSCPICRAKIEKIIMFRRN